MEERFRSILPLGLRAPLFGTLGRIYPKADWAPRVFRAKTTFESLARSSVNAYLQSVSIVREPMRKQLFSQNLRSQLSGYRVDDLFHRYARRAATSDPLALIQYLDMKTYLVGDINTKVDRASMAHSLEVREPLMDHPLIEWMGTLPSSLKIHGRTAKYLLKKTMEPHLPHETLYRPKMGFAVPLVRWFRGPLRETIRSVVLGGSLRECGLFNVAAMEQMLDAHQSGRRDHSSPLWSLLMFEAFLRNAAGAGAQTPQLRGAA
jgi:asparagine synthase (glutamine-hydrolysing)